MPVQTSLRKTGVIAKIIDNNLNSWEDFAGLDINVQAVYQPVDVTAGDWDPNHWSYRGQASMCVLANGTIVRVRLGDWTNTAERRIERQIITDPTDQSQWLAWSWLSYGDNWAVAVERDDAAPAGYRIYHAKTDQSGIYMDNVLIYSGGAAGVTCVRIKPVAGQTNMIYYCTLDQGADGQRIMDWNYIPDTLAVTPISVLDAVSWHLNHMDMAVLTPNSTWAYKFRAMPADASERNPYASDVLISEKVFGFNFFLGHITNVGYWSDFNTYGPSSIDGTGSGAWYHKGPSKRAGFSRIDNLFITTLTDPDYGTAHYLFYTEQHLDQFGNVLSNRKSPVFWSRVSFAYGSAFFLSAPTPVGLSVWGFAGVVESGGYVYLAGNGRVLRRPNTSTEIDITDYVMNGSYELPRDNGKGTGTLVCANPQNVLGAQLGLTSDNSYGVADREVQFGLGVKRPHEIGYTFKRDARWWISGLRKMREEGKDHLEIDLSDFWHRLENPFLDTWMIPGHFTWTDWQPDQANQLPSYTNDTDEFSIYNPVGADPNTVPRLRTVASGDGPLGGTITLYAGFREVNGYVTARFWSSKGGLVFRYIDNTDFYYVEMNANGTDVHQVFDGDDQIIATTSDPDYKMIAGGLLEIYYRFNKIEVWANGSLVPAMEFQWRDDTDHARSGFVGFWAPVLIEVSNFTVYDFNAPVTTRDLMKALLAYVDEQDVQFENDEETLAAPQLDVLWGPQSDLESPAKAMQSLLEASGLNIVFRQDT